MLPFFNRGSDDSAVPRLPLPLPCRAESLSAWGHHTCGDAMPLIAEPENQNQVFAAAFSMMEEAIRDRAFPAASVAVTQAGKLVALKSFGKFVYEEGFGGAPPLAGVARNGDLDFHNRDVTPATVFDLASLTKPIATTTMAAILYERGLLDLEAPILDMVPEFLVDSCGEADDRRREVTVRQLLTHSSGLPAYEKLFLQAQTRDELLRAALTMPLSADPGTRAEYSDIGFIILGVALERIAQQTLDVFCEKEVFRPLGMANTTFNPAAEKRAQIPPTADEREESGQSTQARSGQKPRSTFRRRIIQGEVQDENASVMGGVAGHAGLFSTAEDLARFAQVMLNGGAPIMRQETVSLFTHRESAPAGTSRTLGWDTPSSPSQSGKYFGPRSYGHLGYTGTSLWIDPDRQLSIALLTNRTWPDCSNQAIKQVRPEFYDAIVEAIGDQRQEVRD
jgi:serine-type D-Ala-D-Ala carboxypeptidase